MTRQHKLIQALRGEPHDGVPVWFMRQAGRYLPGYQKVRAKSDFLTMCKTPDLAAEVTVEPLETFGVDAVIIFSDILVPLEAMGLEVVFGDRGPVMANPLSCRRDIEALKDVDPNEGTGFVMDVIRAVKERVGGRVPVLGFAGAPWTLACYALEGSSNRSFSSAMKLVYEDPDSMGLLIEKLTETVSRYLKAQIEAGADAVQLFDTWGGLLAHDVFEPLSLNPCGQILKSLDGMDTPRVLFIKGAAQHMEGIINCGAEAIAVDYTQDIARVKELAAGRVALQGNLAPENLFGPQPAMIRRANQILDTMAGDPGFVFNLGHGIQPKTPVENVQALVDLVQSR